MRSGGFLERESVGVEGYLRVLGWGEKEKQWFSEGRKRIFWGEGYLCGLGGGGGEKEALVF